MVRDCIKVKRGMVFNYNIDPTVDKFNIPKIVLSSGKEVNDHKQYGNRDFLVISNNINNANSPTCNIIPISSSETKNDIPTHVTYNYNDKELTVLCEQVYTVNTVELFRYQYTLSDDVLGRVEKALAVQYGIGISNYDNTINTSLAQLESIIQGIINQRVSEAIKVKKADAIDINDAIKRIGDGLMSMLGAENEPVDDTNKSDDDIEIIKDGRVIERIPVKKSQIDKFYDRYPDTKPTTNNTPKNNRRKWTNESAYQFLEDAKVLSTAQMIEKYNIKDNDEYYRIKYYLRHKILGDR